jgi:hypothetical protein
MQLVEDLLLLKLQLLFVWQVLPLTSSADTKVLTERDCAYLTICNESHNLALGKGVFLATNLYVAYVARYAERYEDY